ncbi:Acyl-CoA dehydrogenase [Palleronia marisminoris]|uniref:Acryloyl-CoA reductase (NADH) n=1 Tax=Palleronia marisminoris TaxID=315423 RepID=A0A1Y5RU13_9RHOB|nr:acyl-CoA dehydrogenase [Palleronia marisminoris]SFG47951.1 Acyl-CoA dehydrogenase [Palleronia marisminoris]SLN25432.1 Acryloyl-CoA reductase (NADH) [Palleronia marisminoris]
MRFELTEERQMLQDGLRRMLADTVNLKEIVEGDAPWSQATWNALAEMGVIGALFTEDQGGFGGAGYDLMVVFEELGRAGAPEPLIESLIAGRLIAELGNAGQTAHVEEIIAGGTQLAFAHSEPGARFDLSRVATTARQDGKDWVLAGRKSVVVNAGAADYLVVSARTAGDIDVTDGLSLFLVPRNALDLLDYPLTGGGSAAELALQDVRLPGEALLGEAGHAFPQIELAVARGIAAQCAEALGMMERIRDLTADYLQSRTQFGQPLIKFQALAFRMADLLIEIEQVRSAAINIAGHLDADRTTREIHVSAAKELTCRVAKQVVEEAIQMHGGIGVTQEYDLGHFVQRLTMVHHRFGDALFHRARFAGLRAA